MVEVYTGYIGNISVTTQEGVILSAGVLHNSSKIITLLNYYFLIYLKKIYKKFKNIP